LSALGLQAAGVSCLVLGTWDSTRPGEPPSFSPLTVERLP